MSEYQTPKDRAYVDKLIKSAPKEAAAFFNLKHTAERNDGVIPIKYRELMSVAVALTTQCAYCIESHIKNAAEAGATREEIAETVFIAAALRAGGAVGHGLLAMRLFEEAGRGGFGVDALSPGKNLLLSSSLDFNRSGLLTDSSKIPHRQV